MHGRIRSFTTVCGVRNRRPGSAKSAETLHVGDYCAFTINDKDWDRGVIR